MTAVTRLIAEEVATEEEERPLPTPGLASDPSDVAVGLVEGATALLDIARPRVVDSFSLSAASLVAVERVFFDPVEGLLLGGIVLRFNVDRPGPATVRRRLLA
jgi:hypothetical protein